LGAKAILVQQIYKGKIHVAPSFLLRATPSLKCEPEETAVQTPLYSGCRHDYAITPWGVIGDYMDYWRLLEITEDYYRLVEITGDH